MLKVHYVAWVEYSDGGMGYVGEGYESVDEAEKEVRERLANEATSEYFIHEHGGVKAIVIRRSEEVKRIEL